MLFGFEGTTLTKVSQYLHDGMDEPELKIIDVFICKLRKKLANGSSGKNFIKTVTVLSRQAPWPPLPHHSAGPGKPLPDIPTFPTSPLSSMRAKV